jgi:hypothetical protein
MAPQITLILREKAAESNSGLYGIISQGIYGHAADGPANRLHLSGAGLFWPQQVGGKQS